MLTVATSSWLSTQEWFASLPTVYLSAGLIITDQADRLLIVKPNYRDGWSLPGGIVEEGEAPHLCATREVAEEVGLSIPAGDLLVVDWAGPGGDRPRGIMAYLFDGGMWADPAAIQVQEEELDAAEFVPWPEAEARMPATVAARVPAAREARASGRAIYLPARR